MSWSALGWVVLREKVKAKGVLRSAASYRSKGERERGGSSCGGTWRRGSGHSMLERGGGLVVGIGQARRRRATDQQAGKHV
jgi:hypothetical protein